MQSFLPFKDSISLEHGDGDSGTGLCGPQDYSLAQLGRDSPPSFILLDPIARKITLKTDENTETGSYAMYLVVKLTDFGIKLKIPFEVFVDECEIQNIIVEPPTTTKFKYDIMPSGATTLIIPYPTHILQPEDCAFHGVNRELEVNGSSNLPSFITLVQNGI